ncbi:MAG: G8 domain-containing protein [Pseudomonadota bacterium]
MRPVVAAPPRPAISPGRLLFLRFTVPLALAVLVAACGGGDPVASEEAEAEETDGGDQLLASKAAPPGAIPGVRIAADNRYTLYVNGAQVGAGTDWTVSSAFPVALRPGDVVAVDATDLGYKGGLIAEVTAGGVVYGSDATWKVSTTAPAGWNNRGFVDAGWGAATDYGAVNAQPWGSVRAVAGLPTTSIAHWIWTSTNATGARPTPRAYFRFVVPRTPTVARGWSNPATWGGTVPPAGATVVVPANTTVLLDQDINLAGLTVAGTLRCARKDLKVNARYILVTGRLECGTAIAPFLHKLTVTLTGNSTTENIGDMGSKFLGAMNGGAIDLFGKPNAVTWTQLATTATAGATQVTVRASPGWAVGDQIVIASTTRDMNQAEVRTITAISGATLTLNQALAHRHQGPTESYGNGTRTWVLDEGAEVGLLTHNIVVQGDADSATTQFGGHTMFMADSPVHMSNVMLHRMGQAGRVGRYPFHWHLAGDASGQYIVSSSIVNSYNRAVTLHQTDGALVKDNVAYNIVGHAYFMEDGSERFNVIDHNLGLVNRRPAPGQAILETDARPIRRGSDGGNFEFFSASSGPATFWISNPENRVTNNAAAGSEGSGFWFQTPAAPTGLSAGMALNPSNAALPAGGFDRNRAHSNYLGFTSCTGISGFGGYAGQARFTNFTSFHNEHGIWPCNGDVNTDRKRQVWEGVISADQTHAGFFSPNMATLRDSLFVGRSSGSPVATTGHRGVQLYDSGHDMQGLHFANYGAAEGGAFGISWQIRGRSGNRIAGMSRQNIGNLFYLADQGPIEQTDEQIWGQIVNDLDGSLTGSAGRVMTTGHPLMIDGSSARLAPSVDAWSSGHRYGRLELTGGGAAAFHTVARSDGASASSNVACPKCVVPTSALQPNAQVILNTGYSYRIAYSSGTAPGGFTLSLRWARPGDAVMGSVAGVSSSVQVATAGWTRVASAAAVAQSAGRTWHLAPDGLLSVKLVAEGPDWEALDAVRFTAPPPVGVPCSGEGGTCTVPAGATATVQYGADGRYHTRPGVTGSIGCNPRAFGGDPLVGVVKACYAVVTALPSNVSACANDFGTCTVPAGSQRTVFYGQNATHLYRTLEPGPFNCSPATFFNLDPLPKVVKSCRF